MKTTVIYHRADFDGIFCREIARKFLGNDSVEYIGWDYGDPKIPFPAEGTVYVLDLSPECLGGDTYDSSKLIWIDHHKTAIEKFPATIPGYRIDGVAACRLAWVWFTQMESCRERGVEMPAKSDYVERKVWEPYAVQLAGEYDIWDKRNPEVDTFQMGLRSRVLSELDWSELLEVHAPRVMPGLVRYLLDNGKLIQDYANQRDAEIVKHLGFVVEFEGLKFLALNTATKGSMQFAAKDVPETGHDALMKFNFNGRVWDVSLYHASHRNDLDLSTIAAKYGGGGHRGACGFRAKTLPFLA